jgi:hypothetical protein
MNGVSVRVVGTKIVVEVDILKAIAEGRERREADQHRKAGAEAQDLQPISVVSEPRKALVVFRTARASALGTPRFLLGRLLATPGALNAFAATGEDPIDYIVRHMNLDPGLLGADDQLQNVRAVRESTRVFSAYELRDGTRIWVITEADRSATTIMLPEEY